MKTMTLFFDEGMIELRFPSQDGTEHMSFDEIKSPLCEMVGVSAEASELMLDFEDERIEFVIAGERTSKSHPGLADDESRIMALLGYEEADLSNVVGLVNAFVSGSVSEKLFNMLLGLEGEENEANPGIAQFLKEIERDS